MRERPVYVYRLHIEWPAEALREDGTVNPNWRPDGWQELMVFNPALCRQVGDGYSEGFGTEFKLPAARRCLTHETAQRHLKPFLAIGCKGWVERSKPVEWPV